MENNEKSSNVELLHILSFFFRFLLEKVIHTLHICMQIRQIHFIFYYTEA